MPPVLYFFFGFFGFLFVLAIIWSLTIYYSYHIKITKLPYNANTEKVYGIVEVEYKGKDVFEYRFESTPYSYNIIAESAKTKAEAWITNQKFENE